ncbi:MAG: ABC transporter ATP-binding protein [Spirochaetia bacterium]
MTDPLLKVRGLKVMFPSAAGFIRAVEGVDMDIRRGECTALVGESGCGKSVTSMSILRLLQSPPALISVKEQIFDGQDISAFSNARMQNMRGSRMSMVFQDAMTSLNPVMTAGKQIDEVFIKHRNMSTREAKKASIETLRQVGVPAPEKRYHSFPHQLSGGMRQRVLIAMAFACKPALMVADEPTTSLDVTIQAQILDLMDHLKTEFSMALLLITHDLSVVANMADTVYVMYSGKIVERGKTGEVFSQPRHPYTVGLIRSVPKLSETRKRFTQIPDTVPHPIMKPEGCYFHPRCEQATDICREKMPVLETREPGRQVRCWHPNE